jgi:hypothetical protein
MEVYLNSIEMGMVYTGALAASEHWYRKEAANLTQFKQLELRLFCQTRKYTATSSLLISIIESKNYACDAYRWKNTILDVLCYSSCFYGVSFSFWTRETKEFGLVTDNDLYTSSKNDMYLYQWLKRRTKNAQRQ